MRRFALVGIPWLLGCASADAPENASDAGVDTWSTVDTALPDGPPDAIFPVEDTGPDGICATPTGTTITASSSYMSAPESLIDGQVSTMWNSGDYTGSFKLTFPKGTRFDRVRIAGHAVPASEETFTFTSGGVTLATATRAVPGATSWLPPFELPVGTYVDLQVNIGMSVSWIAMAEVVVFDSTAGCTAP